MNEIKLNNKIIGRGKPPFVVAEAGINHNGEIDKAFEMIHLAKKVGVDAIKFQTFKADEFIADKKQMFTYKSQGKEITESMFEMFKRYEFSREEWFKIKNKCDDEKILFLSTPQNRSDLDLLLELGITAIKVGSDDFTNLPLLKDYSSTGLPMILSCGMANLAEVHESIDTVGILDGYPAILLLTTSQYPTPPEDANLNKIETLSKIFPMIPIGFSDHTEGHLASSLAIALGAVFFEKHFTLDHNLPGPDHWFSEDPIGLREYVNAIRKAYVMMGSGIIRPTKNEMINKKEFQRVIVAVKRIKTGEIFDNTNLGMRRVSGGIGLSPSFYEKILGKKAIRDYNIGDAINL